MWNALRTKFSSALETIDAKFNDRETAEAVVAVMTAVAHADGHFEEEEQKKMAQVFRTHPLLTQFDTSMLMDKFQQLSGQYALDVEIGHDACLKELKDVGSKGNKDKRLLILRLGVAAARSDGEIEPQEVAVLKRCAAVLGISMEEVGLA